MSFILEALKRSENERQRTVGASLADVQVSVPREQRPWWAFAVGALLIVNLAVLLFVLLRDGDDEPPPGSSAAPIEQTAPALVQNAPPVTAAPPQQGARSENIVQSPAVRSLADEASVDNYAPGGYADEPANLAAAAAVPEGPSIVRAIEGPAGIRPTAELPLSRSEPEEVLPTARDLAAGGTNLPEMHLDIHVHSPIPTERFVFVNMRKYVEGQTLAEGPAIERITDDGVVLNHRGMRFLLPRQ